jgi:hypothetical protein
MPDSDFLAALRALRDGGVEFVVVGGLAAVLNGARSALLISISFPGKARIM